LVNLLFQSQRTRSEDDTEKNGGRLRDYSEIPSEAVVVGLPFSLSPDVPVLMNIAKANKPGD